MAPNGSGRNPPGFPSLSVESTSALLKRVQSGDSDARDLLLCRYLVPLRKWAHGRLPSRARDFLDTDDLVQDTLLRTLNHLETFVPEGDGAFLAYMRRILLNRIKDQLRRAGRRPGQEPLQEFLPDGQPSPLEEAIGTETLENYDAAMLGLPPAQQEAVMLRIEMGFRYEEIARILGCPTANAGRMVVARALLQLARAMKVGDGEPRG